MSSSCSTDRKEYMTDAKKKFAAVLAALVLAFLLIWIPAQADAHSAGHTKCEQSHSNITLDPASPGWGHKTYHGSQWTIKYHYANTITGWVHQHNSASEC